MVLRHEYVLLLAFIQKQKGPSGTSTVTDLLRKEFNLLFFYVHVAMHCNKFLYNKTN